MTQMEMFGGDRRSEGRRLRDDGIIRVLANQQSLWRERYYRHARSFMEQRAVGDRFIGEDLRAYVIKHGAGAPSHPNAWGAMFRSVISDWIDMGAVRLVGIENTTDPRSHARLSASYEVTGRHKREERAA